MAQKPLKLVRFSDPYPVMEHFYTIQGEGMHQGRAAYFIRLAGCDVGCVWCDVKESWTQGYPEFAAKDLVGMVADTPAQIVVITGGEPLMHNLDSLTSQLQAAGLTTHIETSGAHSVSGNWDWFCLSPKKFVFPKEESYAKANELKVIVYNTSDFKWALQEAAKVPESCVLLLQPEWSREKEMLPLIIDFVKANPQWQISLQTHKYMNVP